MKSADMKRIAVVRIRGVKKVGRRIKTTLESLRLRKVNNCVIINDGISYSRMLSVCKDYVAWGEIDKETLSLLLSRAGFVGGKKLRDVMKKEEIEAFADSFIKGEKELKDGGIEPVFRLTPPSGGHKGTKRAAPMGSLGKTDVNGLIRKMI